jgi:hypothetical protein
VYKIIRKVYNDRVLLEERWIAGDKKEMRGREELKSLIEINYVGLSLAREMFEGSSVSFV